MTTSPSRTQSVNRVGLDGVVRCHHNVEVPVLTSQSRSNPGRKFYTCVKPQGDPDKCNFFSEFEPCVMIFLTGPPEWADQLAQSSQASPVHTVSTPITPSKRMRAGTPPTPTVSPSKVVPNFTLNRSDLVDADGDDMILLSEEETHQYLRGRSSSESSTARNKFKFERTEGVSGVGLGSSSGADTHDMTLNLATSDDIKEALEVLNSVPDSIRRLERKLAATEKARDARAALIKVLREQVNEYV